MPAGTDDEADSSDSCESCKNIDPATAGQLTFGVELECQAVLRRRDYAPHQDETFEGNTSAKRDAKDLAFRTLKHIGVPVNILLNEQDELKSHQRPEGDRRPFPRHHLVQRKYEKWQIGEEKKRSPETTPLRYAYGPFELSTRAFFAAEDPGFKEIDTVCNSIKSVMLLSTFKCGLHM